MEGIDLSYPPGSRICVVGKSGSGKTNLTLFLAEHSPTAPVIIFNTKYDKSYRSLIRGKKDILKDLPLKIRNDQDFLLIEPPSSVVSDPDALDDMLVSLLGSKNITVVIDESYMFHNRGQAGPGLVGLLTRGRSQGQTTIAGTQRPAWVSRFLFSEATQGYFLSLQTVDDRKRIAGYTGQDETLYKLDKHDIIQVNLEHMEEDPRKFRLPVFARQASPEPLPHVRKFKFI